MDVSGIVIVNKHAGVTSNDIVIKLRSQFGTRQVGHTGTLDPMATGVLPVLIGRAVKASENITAENKRYTAHLKLGITTDTEDTTGTVLTTASKIPSEEDVLAACTAFTGEILQTPPMYSALKVNGCKLVDLAREGITVERQARPITIHALQAKRLETDLYELDVCCSKGTYIRTLCADIGARLGCGGAMARLTRTESGPFTLAESVTIEQLEAMTEAERVGHVIPLEKFFLHCPAVDLPAFYARLARNGCEIYQKKIRTDLPVGTVVRMIHDGVFFALGEVRDYPDGSAVKAIKIFVL